MAQWAICMEAYLTVEADTAEAAEEAASNYLDYQIERSKEAKITSYCSGNVIHGPQEILGETADGGLQLADPTH